MSVITDKILKGNFAEHFEVQSECFFCCERLLKPPFVMWQGAVSQIWLHPECVSELFIAMARDVHECKIINRKNKK